MKTKNNGLLAILLLLLGIVLGAMLANYSGFGKASVTDRRQQYKSAQAGEPCVIAANCVEPLICNADNVCAEREHGSGDGDKGSENENETPDPTGSE